MNIVNDLEYRLRELNKQLNQVTLRDDASMARNLTRQIINTERALESALNAKEIEPPVVMGPKTVVVGKFEQSMQQAMDEVIQQYGLGAPIQRPRQREPLAIEAKIALTANGMIRCSREAVKQNPCGSVFCQHRADWLCKTESVGTWGQFLKDPKVDTVTKEVHLPICFGLARAKCFIQVRRVGEENAEGWAEYTLSHALESSDIVVSMLLEPRKGDSLAHAMRAIEGFYRMQPEHDETKMLEQLICAERGMHPPWHDDDFKGTVYNLPGLNNQTPLAVIEDLFCTSNSFARLNSPGYAQRGESGLCIACYRKKWMIT